MDEPRIIKAKKALDLVAELSRLLDTGLTRSELSILIALLENGCNPEMTSVSQAASEALSDDGARPEAPMVRAVGQEFVHKKLSTTNPLEAIKVINKYASLQSPECKPLLGLLDQLGFQRMDTHRALLEAAKQRLRERMRSLSPDGLRLLLAASFPYVGVPELRDVPLAALAELHPVPPEFLRQLAKNRELFADLPASVQNQVFELDKKLLQSHALPFVSAYTWETGTLLRALDMDEFLPPRTGGVPEEEQLLRRARVSRRQQRKMSPALKKLVAMVGGSHRIYQGIVDLCVAKYRDSEGLYVGLKDTAFCSLRSQLLMALHDAGANELCSKEPCHKLAWTLDACLRDGTLDERRLRELTHFFAAADGARRRSAGSKRPREAEDGHGASGSGADEPGRVLADAGMVLREPPTMHLICHQVLRRLETLVETEGTPSGDADLVFMTRLLQLAVGARGMLREQQYHFPAAADRLLKTFYPILSTFILEVQLREPTETDEGGSEEIDGNLVALLQKDEVARKVTQIFCLERLASGDTITARTLLACMVAALHKLSDKSLVEWAAFAATLAQRLARMLAAGLISPAHQLWSLAVDSILVKAVDGDTQVHEEVLRLLLAAGPQLTVPQVAQYLQNTLNNSKKSRKRFKRRHVEAAPVSSMAGYSSGGVGYSSGGPMSSFNPGNAGTQSEGASAGGRKGGDGIRSVYQEFPKHFPSLSETTAPILFQYLNFGN